MALNDMESEVANHPQPAAKPNPCMAYTPPYISINLQPSPTPCSVSYTYPSPGLQHVLMLALTMPCSTRPKSTDEGNPNPTPDLNHHSKPYSEQVCNELY